MISKFRTTLRTCLAAVVLIGVLATPAVADAPTAKQRTDFNHLVKERNTLAIKLRRLDRRAADQIRIGNEPLVLHAEQVSTQDQLDLVELRLALLSTRYGIEVPPVPPDTPEAAAIANGAPDPRIEQAFSRGRDRALMVLERQVKTFLAGLDFSGFLAQ